MIHLSLFFHFEYDIWRFLAYEFCQINKLELFNSSFTFLFYTEHKRKVQKYSFLLNLYVLIYELSFKNLTVSVHQGNDALLFLFLYQVYTFKNNLNGKKLLVFHLMRCVNYIINRWTLFNVCVLNLLLVVSTLPRLVVIRLVMLEINIFQSATWSKWDVIRGHVTIWQEPGSGK